MISLVDFISEKLIINSSWKLYDDFEDTIYPFDWKLIDDDSDVSNTYINDDTTIWDDLISKIEKSYKEVNYNIFSDAAFNTSKYVIAINYKTY